MRLGGALVFSGHVDEATGPLEEALTLAQHHELGEQLAQGLSSKAVLLSYAGRAEEAKALFELCVSVSRREGLPRRELTAESNLADLCMTHDLPGAEEHAEAALALARRWGLRANEAVAANNLMYALTMAGALSRRTSSGPSSSKQVAPIGPEQNRSITRSLAWRHFAATPTPPASTLRAAAPGRRPTTCRAKPPIRAAMRQSFSPRTRAARRLKRQPRAIDEAFDGGLSVAHEAVRLAFPIALEASIDLGDSEEADRLANSLANTPAGAKFLLSFEPS